MLASVLCGRRMKNGEDADALPHGSVPALFIQWRPSIDFR
jgi:hypothetical protein